MEEKFLKEILDVVVDIKTDQAEMKQTMNKMEQRLDKIEGRLDNVETEQKEMKQVLGTVVEEQQEMKKVLDNVVEEQQGMKKVLDNVVEEQKGIKQVQQEMKQVQNVMCQDIKYLLAEQADTKNILIELVNKVGEMDSNTRKAKIYQFPRR